MADDEMTGLDRDELDETLAQRFARLEQVPAPDVWDRVVGRGGHADAGANDRHRPGLRRLFAVAAVVIVVAAGTFGVVQLASDGSEQVTVTADGSSSGKRPDSGSDGADACDGGDIAERLREGVATFDYEPSGSPAELASGSVVLRGQLVLLGAGAGGGVVQVKVRDAVGADAGEFGLGAELLVSGSGPKGAAGLIAGDFVAFVLPPAVDGEPWSVLPEGLWVGCGDGGEAEAVLVRPDAPGWEVVLAGGVSLEELWQASVSPAGGRRTGLGAPLLAGDGTAVFDVGLVGGDRFRVSVPETMADGLQTLVEPSGLGPVVLDGPSGTVSISFEQCADQEEMLENRLGSSVKVDGGAVRLCRPDEMLSTTVTSTVEVEDSLDAFDVRPIAIGSRYGQVLSSAWPAIGECGNCSLWGPMVFPDDGVVVNRTGSTRATAVFLDDLSEMWTVDTGGGATYLHASPDGVYVEIDGGDFQRLDPATGEVEWRIERDEAERGSNLTGYGGDVWLLQSSFSVEGDDRAPVFRSIDVATGDVLWTAEGRSGSEWQWTDPVRIGDLVVFMDVTNAPLVEVDPIGGSLRAYDTSSGRLAWTTDLESPTEAYTWGLLVVLDFDEGPALVVRTIDGDVVRVDPEDGDVLWRTAVGRSQIDGTVETIEGRLAISLSSGDTATALDPATGDPVQPR